MACQQGTLTLPDTWFRPPFWDLLMLQLLRPNSSNLPCLYSIIHLEYPLVLSRFCFGYMPCLISFERCQSSCEEHRINEHLKKNLVNGRIRSRNTARSTGFKSTVFNARQIRLIQMKELNVHLMYTYTIYK